MPAIVESLQRFTRLSNVQIFRQVAQIVLNLLKLLVQSLSSAITAPRVAAEVRQDLAHIELAHSNFVAALIAIISHRILLLQLLLHPVETIV